jgi:hypothetical protein
VFNNLQEPQDEETEINRRNIPASFASIPAKLPEYTNQRVAAALNLRGEFIYDADELGFVDLPTHPTYLVEDSALYTGQWKNGCKWGRGKQISKDGSTYEGYWKNNLPNGKGRMVDADGDVYEGDWVDGKPQGNGRYIHLGGSIYEGDWEEMEGSIIQAPSANSNTMSNSIVSNGQKPKYGLGSKTAPGKIVLSDGSTYQGGLRNNTLEGSGLYTWPDGRKYEGDWKQSKMHGQGTFYWPDGKKYSGDFFDNKREGFGVMEWVSGKKYKGYWLNGKQHGKGYIIDHNDNEDETEWDNGKRIR